MNDQDDYDINVINDQVRCILGQLLESIHRPSCRTLLAGH